MANSLFLVLRHYKDKLYDYNVKYPLDRLRLFEYLATSAVIIIGGIMHFFGILGIKRQVLLIISFWWIFIVALVLVLFLTRLMKLKTAYSITAIFTQLIESGRILYLATTHTIISQQFYINELVCVSILMMAVMGFFYKMAISLTITNMLTIVVCWWFIPDIVNSMTINFFILLNAALCIYCYASVEFVKHITMENDEVKGKYYNFLSFMRMNDTEATSLIQLARVSFDDNKQINTLVNQLSEETKNNLINVAQRIYNSKLAQEDKIKKIFPLLSPTELKVCHLVITGHSQKEIARIMDKNEKNISTVRGNIRRKLNLESTVDLRTYLMENIKNKNI